MTTKYVTNETTKYIYCQSVLSPMKKLKSTLQCLQKKISSQASQIKIYPVTLCSLKRINRNAVSRYYPYVIRLYPYLFPDFR